MQIPASEQRIVHPASQSHILIGAPGMARSDPDYFPLYVGNHILGGGGFVSRLMNEVREKRGLAYSVYSYFMPLKQPGAFQIGLQTKKEQADEALQLVRNTLAEFIAKGPTEKELLAAKQNIIGGTATRSDRTVDALAIIEAETKRMANDGPTADELAAAKSYLKGAYALSLDSSPKIAAQLTQIQLDNLGIDYVQRRGALIDAVTIADTKRVAKRLYSGGMLVTVAGRPKGLTSSGTE